MNFKRLLLAFTLLVAAVFLVACTNPTQVLEESETALLEEYADTIASSTYVVSEDLTLITSVGEATITWASNNTDVLANDGSITRQATPTTVTLTATLSYGEETLAVPFTITIAAIPDADQVATAKAALIANYVDTLGDDTYNVTSDLTLVTSIAGATVSWSSSDTAIVATDGTVSRPSYTVGNQNITLTATITVGTASDTQVFYAYVIALDETDEEVMAPVFLVVMAFPEYDGITGDEDFLRVQYQTYAEADPENNIEAGDYVEDENGDRIVDTFPFFESYEIKGEYYDVAWSSSNTDVIEFIYYTTDAEGDYLVADVTRPAIGEPDVDVTLTASITYNGTVFTRTVVYTVLAYQPSTTLASVADVYNQETGSYVKLEGVTIVGKAAVGFFVSDGTTVMYVYTGADDEDLTNATVGDVIDVEGVYDLYFGTPELVDEVGQPIVVTENTTATQIPLTGDVTTIADLLEGRVQPSGQFPMEFAYVSLTVKVIVDPSDTYSGSNYNTYLVPVDYEGTTVVQTVSSDGHAISYIPDDLLIVYYGSNKAAVEALDGKIITLNALLYGYRSDRYIWYVYFLETSNDITVHLTDEESVALAKENVSGEFSQTFYEGSTLTFPETLYDASISYTSSNDAIINPATGAVNIPSPGQTVTITANITKGTNPVVTDSTTFDIFVGVPEISDINTVTTDAVDGDIVHVSGVVTSGEYYGGFTIQDATGAIFIYAGGNADVIAFFNTNIGNEVSVLGEYDIRYDLRQIRVDSDFVVLVDDGAVLPTPAELEGVMLDLDSLDTYQSELVHLTNMYVSDKYVTYGDTYVELVRTNDGEQIILSYNDGGADLSTEAQALLDSITIGDLLEITTVVGVDYGIKLLYTNETMVTIQTLTDADAVGAAISAVEGFFADRYTEAVTLDLLMDPAGTAVTYESDSMYFDEATGAVTMPALYQEMVSVDVTVTKGTDPVETDTTTVTFYVGQETIEAVRAYALDTEVTVRGVVVAEADGTFYIQDPTAGIAVRPAFDDVAALHGYVGDLIEVSGAIKDYYGLIQIGGTVTFELVSDTATAEVATDISAFDWEDDVVMANYQGTWATLSQMLITSIYTSGSGNVTFYLTRVSDEAEFKLYKDVDIDFSTEQQAVMDGLAVNDVIDVESVIGWYNGAQFLYTEESVIAEVTAGDAELLYIDANALVLPTTATEAGLLLDPDTLPVLGDNGSTIAWQTSDAAIIDATGLVVLPSEAADVTLTATFTLNGETPIVKEYVVSVVGSVAVVVSDLFISEVLDWDGGTNKAVEIYNGTGATVNLLAYSIQTNSNANITWTSTTAFPDVDLLPGETFVLANVVEPALVELRDFISTVNFNGNDAVGLFKDGVLIDIFGVFGEDPTATGWTITGGTTTNTAVVRNSGLTSPYVNDSGTYPMWDPTQWTSYDDAAHSLGTHVN